MTRQDYDNFVVIPMRECRAPRESEIEALTLKWSDIPWRRRLIAFLVNAWEYVQMRGKGRGTGR